MTRMLARWRAQLRAVFQRKAADQELDRELSDWVDEIAARYEAKGLSSDEARRLALVETGSVAQVKEDVRAQRPGAGFAPILQDMRASLRSLGRSRGFTAAAVFTLALGIGINAAVFSVVYGILLSPLPYPHAERLSMIWKDFSVNYPRGPLAPVEIAALRSEATLYDQIGGIWPVAGTLVAEDRPDPVRVGLVTSNFFEIFGVPPVMGRWFNATDETPGPSSIIISGGLWQSRFGGADVLGRIIRIDGGGGFSGGEYRIVGVMPAHFEMLFPADATVPRSLDVWAPLQGALTGSGSAFRTVGRLAPDASPVAAGQQVEGLAVTLHATSQFHQVPLHEDLVRDARQPLLVLQIAVGFVLLIVCISVASLTLVRAQGRRKELAIRAAIGARPGRLARLLLAEGLAIATAGGLLGLGIASVCLRLLPLADSGVLPRSDFSLSGPVLAFAALAALGSGLVLTFVPLLDLRRTTPGEVLKAGGQRSAAVARQHVRRCLVVAEIGLSVVLLVGAGLLIRTFLNLLAFNPGFQPEHVLTFRLSLPYDRYGGPSDVPRFAADLEQRLRGLPGVEAAGAANLLPLADEPNMATSFWTRATADQVESAPLADARLVTPGYFEALKVELAAGRWFNGQDDATHPLVLIVDERLARTAFPGEDAVGKELQLFSSHEGPWGRIIGVVRHLRQHRLSEEVREQVFIPMAQLSRTQMSVVVRASVEPAALLRDITREISRIDSSLVPARVRPLADLASQSRAPARFSMLLVSLFACLSLVLACQSLYGVIAYSVAQRTFELGVRAAIGATARDLTRMVAGEGVVLIVLGVGLGLAASVMLARSLQGILFGVAASDPLTFIAVPLAVGLTALAACYGPAWRAGRADPAAALRRE